MTNTEKRIKKQKIKETIKHVIHAVCYVLSVAFIIIMVVVGCQSCDLSHKNEQTSTINHVNNALRVNNSLQDDIISGGFKSKISGDNQYLDIDIIRDFRSYWNVSGQDQDEDAPTLYKERNAFRSKVIYSGQVKTFDFFYAFFVVKEDKNSQYSYYYTLDSLYFYDSDNGVAMPYLVRNDEPYYQDNYYNVLDCEIIFDIQFDINNSPLIDLFEPIVSQSFTFNKTFNYNAPLGLNLTSQFGSTSDGSWVHFTDSTSGLAELYLGPFISGGRIYNGIRVRYVRSSQDDAIFVTNNFGDNDYYSVPVGMFVYQQLEYCYYTDFDNGYTNFHTIVNKRDFGTGYSSTYNLPYFAYASSSTWLNDDFRYISLLSNIDDGITNVRLLSFNNNNQNTISGDIVGADTTNVFTLVASAFTGILPVLNLMILPGITIGMLMFIPLVAMLVFAIIRIIKK